MAPPTNAKSGAPRKRRTQAERSAATRALLLHATIDSLVEAGYTNTTTTRIAERAGVSRGAQMHHFPSKASLVASAVEYLADRRAEELRREAERLPRRGGRVRAALDLLWSSHSGPLFEAALELWLAARTDAELRETLVPVERKFALTLYELCREIFGEEIASGRQFDRLLAMSLNTIHGLALIKTYEIEPRQLNRMWTFTREQLVALFEGEAAG